MNTFFLRPSKIQTDETVRMCYSLFWSNLLACQSQWPRGLRRGSAAARLLGLWIRIPPGHGCLSLVIVVCCQVEVCATGWSLVRRSPTECGVSECDCKASIIRKPWPPRGCRAMTKNLLAYLRGIWDTKFWVRDHRNAAAESPNVKFVDAACTIDRFPCYLSDCFFRFRGLSSVINSW